MENVKTQNVVRWKAFEYSHSHKDPDWFWGVGIAAVAIAIVSIIVGNPLFGIVIIIGAVTLFLHAIKTPEMIEVGVAKEGLYINETHFPYTELASFYIHNADERLHLILKSKRVLTPRIVVPLEKTRESDVRTALAAYLPEEKLGVPVSHQLLEFLGL